MKIALISDIHGNSKALKSVLDDIDKDKDIKHIFCLGDILAVGYESNEVLELLVNRKNITYVKGNHDQEVIDILKSNPNLNDPLFNHHTWIAERIDSQYYPFLINLPLTITQVYENKKIHFTHYHVDDNRNFLLVDSEPTLKKFENHYISNDYDVICFGHHHFVHYFKSKTKLFLNPGPLGINTKPTANYAIFEVGSMINVHFKEIGYNLSDFNKFVENFITFEVPFGEKIIKSYKS